MSVVLHSTQCSNVKKSNNVNIVHPQVWSATSHTSPLTWIGGKHDTGRRQVSRDSGFSTNLPRRHAVDTDKALGALPIGVLLLDATGFISLCNEAAAELFGETLTHRLWRDCIEELFELKGEISMDELPLKDGRFVSVRTSPLADTEGQIVLLQDVTELRNLRVRVEREKRLTALGGMAASLAHQIRTPLSAALLHAEELHEESDKVSGAANPLGEIIGALKDIDTLMRDMLLFARDDSVEQSRFELKGFALDLKRSLATHLSQVGASFSTLGVTPGVYLQANQPTLQTALQNAILNSLDAGAKRVLMVGAVDPNNPKQIVIDILDDGRGVPESMRRKVFDPFYTTRADGSGLGLSVIAKVVHAHRGSVEFAPSRRGANLRITLPRAVGAQGA